MIIGNQLRTAREARGLTRAQISSATKIQPQKIAALEEDAFERLPAGIYLDGIVAAYAREVGLDADALLQRVRAHVSPPPAETLHDIAAVRQQQQDRAPELRLSVAHGMTVFAGVGLMLAVMTAGVRLFPVHLAPKPQQAAAAAKTDIVPAPLPQPDADRTPQAIGTRGVERADEPGTPERVEQIAADAQVAPPARTAESMAAPMPATPAPDDVPAPQAVKVSEVDGAWRLETLIESSSLRAFEGLRLGYRLELRQRGRQVEGTGRKITENGVALNGRRQTPIAVRGTIDGGRLRLTFGEDGARRRSTGTFDLVVKEPELLRGSFSSDAARSAGVVEARRL